MCGGGGLMILWYLTEIICIKEWIKQSCQAQGGIRFIDDMYNSSPLLLDMFS